jgi:SOS-response transcriptional repressor LexA
MQRSYVERHKRIRQELEQALRDTGTGCLSTATFMNRFKDIDVRTVQKHLELLEIDGVIKFLDPDRRAFCTREGLKQLAESLGYEVRETRVATQ